MEESTLRWPTDKEREEMEEVCSIDGVSHFLLFVGAPCIVYRLEVRVQGEARHKTV